MTFEDEKYEWLTKYIINSVLKLCHCMLTTLTIVWNLLNTDTFSNNIHRKIFNSIREQLAWCLEENNPYHKHQPLDPNLLITLSY